MRHAALGLLLLVGCALASPDLTVEHDLPEGVGYTAYLVSYDSGGLKVYAMVAVPKAARPQNGYPVLIANHGYVPDPRQYAIGVDGVTSRPGDYYRSVPELYTSRGFLVVMPDYRGHNSSEGYEQIKDQGRDNMQSVVDLYAADVIAVISHVGELENADTDQVFMWSHSMGGAVSMRVLLATNIIKAASFWSTMNLDDLEGRAANLNTPVVFHHSSSDPSTSYANSANAVRTLIGYGRSATLRTYAADDHYFVGEMRELAADRDAAFFISSID